MPGSNGGGDDGSLFQQRLPIVVLALVGFLFISTKVFSYLRLLLSLFVLPGKPVSGLELYYSCEEHISHRSLFFLVVGY